MNDAILEKMLAALTPEIVAALKHAIETGKWPDGRRLSGEQRTISLQAVIAWEHHNLPEQERTGYIDKGDKDGEVCDSHVHEDESAVRFRH
jgi:uncharacterized protein YeaC (DUF1315 family)